jgi:isopenicillin N synthase-like dioxygenase
MTQLHTAQQTGEAFDVPVIDLTGFITGDDARRQAIAQQVDAAASTVGFMQIQGHGVPVAAADRLAAAMDEFFTLPLSEKSAYRAPDTSINRGYSGLREERLSYSLGVTSPADLFEAFNVGSPAASFPGFELPAEHYPANIWPQRPAKFRASVAEWMDHAQTLAHTLTRVFALALNLPIDYFEAFTDHSVDTLRMNRYHLPEGDVQLEPGQLGMGAHTDFGIVTVLWADDVQPGLQVLDADGGWHDIRPVPGALLINLGDALARWTNDRWLSTMHRVVAPIDPSGRPVLRRSAAFFHDGNADAVISCLPSCLPAGIEPSYRPVTVADHLSAKLGGSRGLALNPNAGREAERLTGALR